MLAKSVNDAAWAMFIQMLENKAVEAGSLVVKIDPRYTSQTCPNCDAIAKKELSVRWHSCPCGCEMHSGNRRRNCDIETWANVSA